MFDFLNKWFNGPEVNYQEDQEFVDLLNKKSMATRKEFLSEKELPEWVDEVVSYNCGWDEKRKGYMLLVTVVKLSEKNS